MNIISWIVDADVAILQFIADNFKSGTLDAIMKIITLFGEHGIFWIACTVACLAFRKTRRMGFTMAIALIIGFALGNGVLKNAVARPRPYTLEQFAGLRGVAELSDWSFPSGHTLASFECAVAMFFYDKRFGIPALVLAFSVAISRLYLMVHFPSDVVAGAVLGTLFAVIAYFIIKALYTKFDLENKLVFPFERKNK